VIISVQTYRRMKNIWVARSSYPYPVKPEVLDWLKSDFAKRLINKNVKGA